MVEGNDSVEKTEKITYIKIDDLVVDLLNREFGFRGKWIRLTRIEFRLLWALASNLDRVLSREELIRRIWGGEVFVERRTVDAHIARLRRVFLAERIGSPLIETEWGIGYCLRKQTGQLNSQTFT